MIQVTESIALDEADIQVEFVQGAGPGGQNVNKVATQAQLRYNIAQLPEWLRPRLAALAGSRLTEEGVLLIQARRYRTQEQNRADAIQRLVELVRRAARPVKARRQTRPTAASREKRLESKRRQAAAKRMRGQVSQDE